MAKQFKVELKGQALKDLEEIAGLCKETPEALLARAFAEWVELREDLSDIEAVDEILKNTRPEEWVSHEQAVKDLEARERPRKRVRTIIQS